MPSPSINIGINGQGKSLVKKIDTHFRSHEIELYSNFILTSSIESEKNEIKLSYFKENIFEVSANNDLKIWFDKELYSNVKNLVSLINDSISNTVIVNIIVPVAEEHSVLLLQKLLEAIRALNNDEKISGVEIKIFTIIYPLNQHNYSQDTQITEKLIALNEITLEYDYIIKDIYYIDDKNSDKIALKLNSDWLAFALGEFLVFQMISQTSLAIIQNKSKVFGIGIIHFNEILFRSVITNKILQYKFEQEGITEDEGIQLSDVIQICNPFISTHQNFFQKFLDTYPNNEENKNDLTKNSKVYIDQFKADLETFVTDVNHTIGQSKVILANLLGEDDKKLEGISWSDQRLNINDLEFDIIKYFNQYVEEDQRVDFDNQRILRDRVTELNQSIKSDYKSLKALEEQSEEIHSDLDIAFEEGIFSVNGKRINASGYIPSPINSDDDFYTYTDEPISKSVDLSKYFSKVKNQGNLGSCTAFPVAAVYEFAAKQNAKNVEISELFIYYNTRKSNGKINEDTGATLLETINSVKQKGACYSENHPYSIESFTSAPSEIAYTEAQHQVVDKSCRVSITPKDFKHAIQSGYPIIIGLKLFESFYPKDITGFVPFPSTNEIEYENHGNHALLIVGYNDDEKLFKLRNSWGTSFGENGYCYAPYDYIANPKFCLEAYIITNIVDLSYNEFSYNTDTSFSFLKDALIRIKTIKEYNIRTKQKELKNIKKEYDLIAIKNEENSEQIKNPLFRKRLLNELKTNQQPDIKDKTPSIEKANIEAKHDNKVAYLLIGTGLTTFLLCLILNSYISIYFVIIVALIGVGLLFFGCKKLFYKTEKIVSLPIVTEEEEEEEEPTINKKDLYAFEAADKLFGQFDTMNKNLIIRYKALASYFSMVKDWQKEIENNLQQTEFSSPTFVVNVVKEKPLLDYIEKEKHVFLQNLQNLSATFHKNYNPTYNNVNDIFKELRKKYLNDIQKNTENILDISIVDYIQGKQTYPYFNDAPKLNITINNINKVSSPFCNIKQSTQYLDIQNYVIHEKILSNSEAVLEEFSQHMPAGIKPIITNTNNRKKYVAIQVSALADISSLVRYNLKKQ